VFNIALFEPEIPPNTGNIIRLCANSGAQLHLIKPFGFEIDDKRLRRAGLDYHEWANVKTYDDYNAFLKTSGLSYERIFACTTKGSCSYANTTYKKGDTLLFGPETRGLPSSVLEKFSPEQKINIPMLHHSRSLNLSNATAIILYEAWRQIDFQTI